MKKSTDKQEKTKALGFQFPILHSTLGECRLRQIVRPRVFLILLLLLCNSSAAIAACNTNQPQVTPTSAFTDNGDGTVTHNKTGLMWKRCSEGQTWDGVNSTCTGTAATYTWQGALGQADTLNTTGGFATFTDWRVPNIKELASIVEEQCNVPAINAVIFPATPSLRYWSSSSYSADALSAWYVNFGLGHDHAYLKSINIYVRVVR
ncbi:MAG: DUF1566 domain-containing protein [Mariprofundaceae bacterium]